MPLRRAAKVVASLALSVSALACDGPTTPTEDTGPRADAYVPPGVDARVSTDDAPATGPMSPLVDPMCLDGQYREALPNNSASLADLTAGFTSAGTDMFVQDVLTRRYPFGWTLVDAGRGGRINCLMAFVNDRSSASAEIGQLGTAVHECGHFADLDAASGSTNVYFVRSDLTMMGAQGDSTARRGQTFARSLIRNDSYQAARPVCPMGSSGPRCDFYATIYLNGDPTDGNFESGDQGFNLLLEEVLQYSNSLAVGYAYADQRRAGSSVSDRDGMLTFLWYVERYLHMARLEYPMAYEHLVNGDGGRWRQLILTIWGRAWLYLEATESLPGLGIEDDMLMPLVMTPELLDEIERLRTAQGC
jgi:hypothetical protein